MPRRVEELNASLRDLIEVVRTADLDDVDLEARIATLDALCDELRPHVYDGPRMQAALRYENLMEEVAADVENAGAGEVDDFMREGRQDPGEFFPYSPIVGLRNPIAPPVRLWRAAGAAGGEIHGSATLGAAYNGPPDCVHGGVIAAVFDELLGCVCVTNGIGGFTGTLRVVYRTPTPIGVPLALRGWHDRSEGRKVFAKGTLYQGETLCAEAEGIFVRSPSLPGGVAPPG